MPISVAIALSPPASHSRKRRHRAPPGRIAWRWSCLASLACLSTLPAAAGAAPAAAGWFQLPRAEERELPPCSVRVNRALQRELELYRRQLLRLHPIARGSPGLPDPVTLLMQWVDRRALERRVASRRQSFEDHLRRSQGCRPLWGGSP